MTVLEANVFVGGWGCVAVAALLSKLRPSPEVTAAQSMLLTLGGCLMVAVILAGNL